MSNVIGLSGPAGAGKDTVANWLVDELGFTRVAFADAVRESALLIDPILQTNWTSDPNATLDVKLNQLRLSDVINIHGWDWAKRNVPEVRRLLQVIGTEQGRQLVGENVWVNIANKKISLLLEHDYDVVITDVRFENEVNYVRHTLRGEIVRIERPNNPHAIPATHASEIYVPEADRVIINDGSVEDLQRKVSALW